MAWIRWRGQSAQLMTTVWQDGKTRQRYLVSLGGVYTIPDWMRQQITERFPSVPIDWEAIQAAVVQGPPGNQPPSAAMLGWAEVEARLRDWARTGPEMYGGEREALHCIAAHVLESWRAQAAATAEAAAKQRTPAGP